MSVMTIQPPKGNILSSDLTQLKLNLKLFSFVGCDLGDVQVPLRECRSLLMQARRPGAAVVFSTPTKGENTMLVTSPVPGRTLALMIDCSTSDTTFRKTEILSEILLRFSPRVFSRVCPLGWTRPSDLSTSESPKCLWFFLDISLNQYWIEQNYTDEARFTEAVMETLGSINYHARIAIADTPQAAQALAVQHGFWISPPGRTQTDLNRLPLSAILHLEGLEPWSTRSRVDTLTNFFSLLGFYTLGDLSTFNESFFQERWGELGAKVYQRLQGCATLDPQPIVPFVPTEALKSFVHLDFPSSIVSLLFHEVEEAMKTLFARLKGRRLIVRRLTVRLRCENSDHEYVFSIEPSAPTREIRFFKLLLENRLEHNAPLNPIRDFEIEIDPLPEIEISDNFQDRTTEKAKLALLKNILVQDRIYSEFTDIQVDAYDANKRATLKFSSLTQQSAPLHRRPRSRLSLIATRDLSDRPIYPFEQSWWEGRAGPRQKFNSDSEFLFAGALGKITSQQNDGEIMKMKKITAKSLKTAPYESQEELFFACTSFIILLVFATADVLARIN